MQRPISEEEYMYLYGEHPGVTYTELIEKGEHVAYFDKMCVSQFAEMCRDLCKWLYAHAQKKKLKKIALIDFEVLWCEYMDNENEEQTN